jgi:hypothetical protein
MNAIKAAAIVAQIADGVPLRVICRQPGMPTWRTVYNWIDADAEFAKRMEAARQLGYEAIAQEALQIADTPLEGVETTTDEKGTSTKRGDMLGHRKLQIETRLKLLAKWHPTRYGDKVTLAGDAENPLTVTVQRLTPGAK